MFQPQTYRVALLFLLVNMICSGSWDNLVKACSGYRFQLFHWDYVIGLSLGAVAFGVSLGSYGSSRMGAVFNFVGSRASLPSRAEVQQAFDRTSTAPLSPSRVR